MIEVVGVRFKSVGKIYYFDPKGVTLPVHSRVIVETVRGLEIGDVVIQNSMVEEDEKFLPLSPVVRVATQSDIEADNKNREKEKYAFGICNEKIKKHKLDMTLVDVEYTFDNSKIIFSFVADGRIDFRDLVKDLASVFRTRIELRQIGVRDETKSMGSLGMCGRKCCCSSFLSEFIPVSVKMAKDQSLSTNPQKISGACGKLICCLNFEEPFYEAASKMYPKVGASVKTPDGIGTVTDVNVLTEKIKVRFEDDSSEIKVYEIEDIRVLKSDKKNGQAKANNDKDDSQFSEIS